VGLSDVLPQWASSAVFGLVVVVVAVAAEVKRRRLRDKAAGDDSTAQLRTDLMKHTYLMAFLGVSLIAFVVFIEVPRLM